MAERRVQYAMLNVKDNTQSDPPFAGLFMLNVQSIHKQPFFFAHYEHVEAVFGVQAEYRSLWLHNRI